MADKLFSVTQLVDFADDKPVRLVIDGLSAQNEQLYLNRIRGDIQPNFQLLYAIGPGKYINGFDQRLGPFAIDGVYVLTDCEGQQDTQTKPPFMTFYEENNILTRVRNGQGPIRITFEGIVLEAWIVKLTIGDYQKEGIEGHAFTLNILAQLQDPAGDRQDRSTAEAAASRAKATADSSSGSSDTVPSGPRRSYSRFDEINKSARANLTGSGKSPLAAAETNVEGG